MTKFLNIKKLKIVVILVGVSGVIAPAFWLMAKNRPQAALISPLSDKSPTSYEEPQQSISYYITTSQEFLNKARFLANQSAGKEQTPEEKQTILQNINKALDLVNQAIAAYPNDDRSFAQRATIYQALTPFIPQSANLAIQDLREAIKLNRQNSYYYNQLANIYLSGGDLENAAIAFYNAHLLSPTEVQTIYNLADALEKSGQLAKARHFFEKLIALLPPDDKNLGEIKNRQNHIQALLSQAKLQYLSEAGLPAQTGSPNEFAPKAPTNSAPEIIGTQELPLEQAALAKAVIIASDQSSPDSAGEQSASWQVNAKTGEGVIPAGQTQAIINNKNVSADKQIVIAPIGETQNKVVSLVAKKSPSASPSTTSSGSSGSGQAGWFKVGIDTPIDSEIKFQWWILE